MPRQADAVETNAPMVDGERPGASAPAASPAEALAAPERVFEVTAPASIFVGSRAPAGWSGGSHVTFKVGKILTAAQYDIAFLREQGVQMREVVAAPDGG